MKRAIAIFLTLLMLFSILPTAFAAEEKGETKATNNFVGYPSVFVSEDNYRISFLTNTNGMAWVEIGGVAYEDTTAGLMDWETKLHGITVPQSVLNSAKSYTICFQPLSEKPAYDAAPGAKQTKTYSFDPVLPGEDPILLCVSDQHDNNTGAAAVTKYGKFDAVVFGGDYTAAISTEDIANNFLKYSGEISKGTKPVIYPRGNHEIRGQYTHWVDEVMPISSTGKSYYELLLGDVYAIVLDCGGSYTDNYEDIADTIDYEPYRVEQTRWLEQVYLKGTWKQYDKRIIISHVPFITQANFKDIFTDWTTILNRMDMSVLVSGHTHTYTVYGTNHSSVKTAPNFPAFVMSTYTKDPYVYTGTFLTLGDQNFTINHVDSSSLAVKNTYTFTNKTYGATTEPKTTFETAVAETPAPAASAGTASIPAVSSPFSAHPTVFLTEDNYQISFLTEETGMAWVEIGGVKYKDSTMGVMDWESKIHKITVPQSVLDSARKYKICFQSMSTRKAYTPVHGSTVSRTYPFTPAPASPTFLFMSEQLNDNTNAMKVAAYKNYDVFVCGGKYMKAANTEGNRSYLLKLCGETTQGVIPTIFTRGNRELRGFAAHDVVDSMGTSSTGEAYFYFTTSNIFGIVLDTGEYAADSTASFGGTVRFQKYREQQTRWLRELLAEGKWKAYDTRIVICHIPFTAYTDSSMKAVFKEWTNILNEMGVTLMVAGHVNNYSYYPVGDSRNVSGPSFPMLTMSDLDNGDYAYSGTYVTFNGKTFTTENVLSTKKVREKKTVTNPLYVEEPELVSDYTPTTDQNALYFGFGNNPEDYQRYTENPVYGGANYDTANILRTQNFYNGKGAIDFPVADIQNFDYTTGTVRTKVNGPYPTQSSYSGCVTRRFVFGETNDTTASVGSLKFDPANAEVFQVRFKLENLKLRSDISASDAARCVSLQYYKNTATSAVRNANSYGGSVVTGKYMTVTLNLDSGFRGADVITKFWVEFHGFFKSDDSKDAYVTLDYVYIGPKATMPTKDDSYLFFNYTDSTAAHYRYASNSYSGYNFDLETRWNVERKDPATGNTVTVSKTVDKEEGTLNLTFSDWDTQVKSTIFGTYEGGVTPLNYNPSKAEVVQLRFKMNNIKAAANANPFIRLWYTKNVNGTNQSAYDQAYSLGTGFVSDGEWMVVTIPLYTQAEIDANASVSGFPTTTFAKAGTIVGVRMGFHNFTANVAGVPGEIIVDYIYVGPKSDMPTKVYTVNFYDENGTILQTNQVYQGESVSYTGAEPTKAPDAENHYTFGGWVAQQGGSTAVNLNNVQSNTDAYPFFAPTGHAVAYKDAQDATCTAPGYTGDSYCTECGYAIAEGTPIDPIGHNYTYAKIDGRTHMVGCENCDLSETATHSYVDGNCLCGDIEIKEPIVDENITIGHTLNLASDISVNFAVKTSLLADYVNHYMVIEIPVYSGNEQTGTRSVTIVPELTGDYYYYTLTGLTAVNMGDVVSAQLHMEKNGQPYLSKVDSYSVAQYAYAQLNKANMPDSLKALCADLLRYGKEAQIYKAYRTDALVDAAMTDTHKSYLSDTETVTFNNVNETLSDLNNPVITWAGKALNLDSKVSVKYIFTLGTYTGKVEDLSLKVNYVNYSGQPAEVILTGAELYNAERKYYAFTFDGLLAAELRSVTEVAVYEGGTRLSQTLRYSPDTYGNNKTGQLLILCKALMAYSDTAKAYFS